MEIELYDIYYGLARFMADGPWNKRIGLLLGMKTRYP